MANPTAKYDRLPFPAEIRNQIYHSIFNNENKYQVLGPIQHKPTSSSDMQYSRGRPCFSFGAPPEASLPGIALNLSLVRTSKGTKEEVLPMLYEQCTFRYSLDLWHRHRCPLPLGAAADRMQNLQLDIEGIDGAQKGCESTNMFAGILNVHAGGADILRNTIHIKVHVGELATWSCSADNSTERAFFEELKKLKGFREVIIEMYAPSDRWLSRLRDLYEPVSRDTKSLLKPSLGEAMPDHLEVDANGRIWACSLCFHPRINAQRYEGIVEDAAMLESMP